VFEDLGSPLCLIDQKPDGESILYTFPIRHSPAWRDQQVPDAGSPSSIMMPCSLPLAISCPPRVGGFLHPHCYGVPGHINTCKKSQRPYYLVRHTFEGGGTVICRSWASAYYYGRATSHFSRGGPITMKSHLTDRDVLQAARLTTPTVVKRPIIIPYLREQLACLDMLDEDDLDGTVHDPVTISGQVTGHTVPRLFSYKVETLWQAPGDATGPHFQVPIAASLIVGVGLTLTCLLAGPPSNIPSGPGSDHPELRSAAPLWIPSTVDSLASSSGSLYSSSEERDRSKDCLKSLDIPPLPLATNELHQRFQNLPWQLSGQHWCHDQVHACNIMTTPPDTLVIQRFFDRPHAECHGSQERCRAMCRSEPPTRRSSRYQRSHPYQRGARLRALPRNRDLRGTLGVRALYTGKQMKLWEPTSNSLNNYRMSHLQ
jgi:hypothetical protein